MNPGRWGIERSVLVNLVVLLVIGGGIVAFLRLPREIFPSFSDNQISVVTEFPGASPAEVELLVTANIEEELADIRGIEEITSLSSEGLSRVTLHLEETAPPIGRVIDDVEAAIDTIDHFPDDVEESVVSENQTRFPVLSVSLFGDLDPKVMRRLADDVEDALRLIPGVSQVVAAGVPDPIIWVEVDEDRLREFELSLTDLENALRARNLNAPGGSLITDQGSILVRTLGEFGGAEDLLSLPLRSGISGREVTLGRLASVREGFEDPPRTIGFAQGRRALKITVFKDETGDALDISDAVVKFCDDYRATLPAGVDLISHGDLSVYVRNRLRTMNSTAVLALSLVLATLCLFLSGRIALLATIGIPVAFFGAALAFSPLGINFSMIAMFAFIIVLGMVVDDAIVLCENVYRHWEEGKSPKEAAIEGTKEVAAPVTCTILTTVAAFLPMLMVSGEIGEYTWVISVVVSITLVVSLFEALLALPVHFYHLMEWLPARRHRRAPMAWTLEWLSKQFPRLLTPVLRWRYVALATLLAVSMVIWSLGGRYVKFELFGEVESKQFFVNFESSPSTRIEEMATRIRPAQELVASLPNEEIESYNTNVGILFHDVKRFETGPHRGQIFVDLKEGGARSRDSETIINHLRDELRDLPGMRKVQVLRPQAGPAVPAIEIGVEGESFAGLSRVADEVQDRLKRIDGVRDVRSDFELGKEELQLTLRPEAEAMGLTVASLARQVRSRYLYAEASHVHRSRDAPEIRVRLPEHQRDHAAHVPATWIRLPTGNDVPLEELVQIDRQRGPSTISRTDQRRTVTVLADVNRKKANPQAVVAELREEFPRLESENPGVRLKVKGESLELDQSVVDLLNAVAVAMAAIYVLLAALFRSYFQPLIVMAVIPFALDGIILGHLAQGKDATMLSMLGFLALVGIVVNDSLVLVSFINDRRRQGKDAWSAVIEGASLRVRPILLTSITTIIGLIPLAFFASGQAAFLSPMAISIVWGLALATVLTLVVIPCLYLVSTDIGRWIRLGTGSGDLPATP